MASNDWVLTASFTTLYCPTSLQRSRGLHGSNAELLTLLSQRDCQGVWTLADHLASGDWRDNHILSYEALTALEWQEHLSSRLQLVASLAKCLLGPRVLEFFRFRSAGCLGQKTLYPLAIVVRQLSAEGRGEVLERAQQWPEPVAEQVSRAVKAVLQPFPGREMSF